MSRGLLVLVLCSGCDLWPRTNPYDPIICEPRCPAGFRCHYGLCVTMDRGVPDTVPQLCGNGIINAAEGEVCEPGQLRGDTCASFGFEAGELRCGKGCRAYDTSRCRGCDGSWCTIPAGTFVMGSPPSEPCREANGIAETQHQVTLTHQFKLSQGEVPRWAYGSTMVASPSTTACPDYQCPVESVSWHMAVAYCNALTGGTALKPCYSCMLKGNEIECVVVSDYLGDKIYTCPGFRLPTEAEWEHAYRAGTSTATHVGGVDAALCSDTQKVDPGLAQIAWYSANSGGAPHSHSEGLKQPNAWGLYDMAGNVAEWCHDYFQKDLGAAPVVDPVGQVTTGAPTRVLRGGSWDSPAGGLRAAARETNLDTVKNPRVGFRCARTLVP